MAPLSFSFRSTISLSSDCVVAKVKEEAIPSSVKHCNIPVPSTDPLCPCMHAAYVYLPVFSRPYLVVRSNEHGDSLSLSATEEAAKCWANLSLRPYLPSDDSPLVYFRSFVLARWHSGNFHLQKLNKLFREFLNCVTRFSLSLFSSSSTTTFKAISLELTNDVYG